VLRRRAALLGHDHPRALQSEECCCCQPGEPGADDQDIGVPGFGVAGLGVHDARHGFGVGGPAGTAGVPAASESTNQLSCVAKGRDLGGGPAGGRVQLCIATAFTCPFEGRIPVERVLAVATDPRVVGADEIVVCDTLGQAAPADVSALVSRVRAETAFGRIGFHGHDTWGQGVANSLVAIQAGAAFVDGSLGGLGGCPFAPGASGNASTEDLLFGLRPAWLTADRFARIAEAGRVLLGELGEPDRSRAGQAHRIGAAGPDPVPGVT
jgi:hypothetical protein